MVFNARFLSAFFVFCSLAASLAAQELRFEFKIDPLISGSRPWDGTASSSSAADDLGIGSALFDNTLIGRAADTFIDMQIDETQASIAPPDPYICIIQLNGDLPDALSVDGVQVVGRTNHTITCTPRDRIKPNRAFFNVQLPSNLARMDVFGVALVDSDAPQFGGSVVGTARDELIGFGVYITHEMFELIQQGDLDTQQRVGDYERYIPDVVDMLFGLSRDNNSVVSSPDSHTLQLERLTARNCEISCRFGDAALTIKGSIGGW